MTILLSSLCIISIIFLVFSIFVLSEELFKALYSIVFLAFSVYFVSLLFSVNSSITNHEKEFIRGLYENQKYEECRKILYKRPEISREQALKFNLCVDEINNKNDYMWLLEKNNLQ